MQMRKKALTIYRVCQKVSALDLGVSLFMMLQRYVGSAAGKIHKLRTANLREFEAPWLTK